MSEILGHDCDGRPLRAGDRVVIVAAPNVPTNRGKVTSVRGPHPEDPKHSVVIDIAHHSPYYAYYSADSKWLRRIDDRPELGSWDEIEKITGFNPTKQETPA